MRCRDVTGEGARREKRADVSLPRFIAWRRRIFTQQPISLSTGVKCDHNHVTAQRAARIAARRRGGAAPLQRHQPGRRWLPEAPRPAPQARRGATAQSTPRKSACAAGLRSQPPPAQRPSWERSAHAGAPATRDAAARGIAGAQRVRKCVRHGAGDGAFGAMGSAARRRRVTRAPRRRIRRKRAPNAATRCEQLPARWAHLAGRGIGAGAGRARLRAPLLVVARGRAVSAAHAATRNGARRKPPAR